MKKLLFALLSCAFLMNGNAQQSIELKNPSFEGEIARPGKAPNDWLDCGFAGETPPDIQPEPTFSISTEPQDGKTYLGMVVRDNETWESIAQLLPQPLQKDSDYQLSIYLARSELYISISRVTEEVTNYSNPSILRIWGSNTACGREQLLAETDAVVNEKWKPYTLNFHANADWKYLVLEAYFAPPTGSIIPESPYCGNILVDNIVLTKI